MAIASLYPARALGRFTNAGLLPSSLASALCQSICEITTRRNYGTSTPEDTLVVKYENGLGRITINRPNALNAKNCGALESLAIMQCSFNAAQVRQALFVNLQKW